MVESSHNVSFRPRIVSSVSFRPYRFVRIVSSVSFRPRIVSSVSFRPSRFVRSVSSVSFRPYRFVRDLFRPRPFRPYRFVRIVSSISFRPFRFVRSVSSASFRPRLGSSTSVSSVSFRPSRTGIKESLYLLARLSLRATPCSEDLVAVFSARLEKLIHGAPLMIFRIPCTYAKGGVEDCIIVLRCATAFTSILEFRSTPCTYAKGGVEDCTPAWRSAIAFTSV